MTKAQRRVLGSDRRQQVRSARRNGRKSASETRDAILDAAELLFADHGFDGVSLREITNRAGVLLALVSYHFETKEALFEAIIARRADELNRRRRKRLDELRHRDGKPPEVAEIIAAFIRPIHELALSREGGWSNWTRLIAQIAQTNRWVHLIQRYFDETAMLFVRALGEACPTRSEKWLVRSFMFVIGVMVSAYSGNRRGAELIHRVEDRAALEETFDQMIPFLAAGFTADAPAKASHTRIRR